jgi:hypothetical protein
MWVIPRDIQNTSILPGVVYWFNVVLVIPCDILTMIFVVVKLF